MNPLFLATSHLSQDEVQGPVKLSILDPTCWQTEEVELSEKFPQAWNDFIIVAISQFRYGLLCINDQHSVAAVIEQFLDSQDELTSEGECRNECRKSVQCWAYQYDPDSSTCYFAGYRCQTGDPSCETETVLTKYHCEQGKLCVELVTDQWYLNGQYSEAQLEFVWNQCGVEFFEKIRSCFLCITARSCHM